MRKIDMVGKRFGKATIIKEISPHLDPSGRKRRQFHCLCDCGTEFDAIGEALRNGTVQSCGCVRKEMLSQLREKDLSGRIFGRWFIENEAFRDRYGIHWNAICICGNRGTPTTNNLLRGASISCGCYNLECISKRKRKDIINQRFFKLKALECIGKNEYNNYLWKCVCDCGREIITTASRLLGEQIVSCGCTKSKNECVIENYLKINNIAYEKNKHFKDLKLKTYLYFDFAIKDCKKCIHLIEYQGVQHYIDVGYFGKQQREITDKMKKDYCFAHNIPLYEIRYDEDVISRLDEIITQVNPVPSSQETA